MSVCHSLSKAASRRRTRIDAGVLERPPLRSDHCFFFKSIEDANRLRRQIAESFERAALPGVTDMVGSFCHQLKKKDRSAVSPSSGR